MHDCIVYLLLTDQELIQKYKSTQNQEILGELYARYMTLVYGVCLKYLKDREDAKDAVMAIFEKLVDALLKHQVGNFKSWLHVMAKNHCLMILRSAKSKAHYIETNDLHLDMEFSLPMHHEDEGKIDNQMDGLDECIERLSDDQKECIKLFYLEEKSYKQVSVESGYELKKVKSYIQNGKRNLKNCLESHE